MDILEVVSIGAGVSVQDQGRRGWKKFGLPPGGAMDRDSAAVANRLVGNEEGAPVLELLFTGARFRCLHDGEFAIAGADVDCSHPIWKSFRLRKGDELSFGVLRSGVWTYLAVRGGFVTPCWFGSASVYPRAGLGGLQAAGNRLGSRWTKSMKGVDARFVPDFLRPDLTSTPCLPVSPGPEWDRLGAAVQQTFLETAWVVSTKSDRSGYRLEGRVLPVETSGMMSSPMGVGFIQVPPGGSPIVLLRDGPTVGGYPRLAILGESEVSRFVQCAPGTQVQFQLRV